MTYVMSDLHGDYEKYQKMLERIRFSDDDTLYILGDIVDRGPDPCKILYDMSMRPNVIPMMGNHEHMAEEILRMTNVEITEESLQTNWNTEMVYKIHQWYENGGYSTAKDFHKLSLDDREYILDYFTEFTFYEEITVAGRDFLLLHSGLPDFVPEKSIEDYSEILMLYAPTDYTRQYYTDRYLVTGHIPTFTIDPSYDGKIYRKNGHIALDCGVCHGKPLGCLRLDDFREFYVD